MGDTNQYRRDDTNEVGGISKYMRGVTLVTLGDTSEHMRGMTLVNCGTQVGTLVPAAAGSSQRLRGRGRRWGGQRLRLLFIRRPMFNINKIRLTSKSDAKQEI